MAASVVEVPDLVKVYPGGTRAVDGISFAVDADDRPTAVATGGRTA